MFHFSMEKVKSASRGIFWLGGALPAVGSLFTDFLSPLGPYSFFLALLLGMLTVLALIAAMIPPVNRVLHSWSAHWAEGVLAVLLCGFLVFSGMFALELSTDPHKGFLASESEKLAEIQKILLNIADTTARIDERTERIEAQTARTDARTERIEAQTSRTDARTERVEGKVADIDRKMAGLKRETSDNPRKELANLGVPYDARGYMGALNQGDEHALALFYRAGMDFYIRPPFGDQPPCIVQMCKGNISACMKAVAIASRYNVDVQKGFSIGSTAYQSAFNIFDKHLYSYVGYSSEGMSPVPLDKYPLVKEFASSKEATYTIGDVIMICATNNAEQIARFMREYNIPYDNALKLRREFADYFSAVSNHYMQALRAQEQDDLKRGRKSNYYLNELNRMKPSLEAAEQYERVTQQLEKALGVSR